MDSPTSTRIANVLRLATVAGGLWAFGSCLVAGELATALWAAAAITWAVAWSA